MQNITKRPVHIILAKCETAATQVQETLTAIYCCHFLALSHIGINEA